MKEAAEGSARRAKGASERNLRKEGRLGYAYVGVGRNQSFFRLFDVGPPLEKRRRNARGHLGQMRLIGEFQAASDRSRISAQENAEVVLSLFHQFLGGDHGRLSLLNQQLRLVDVGNRVLSAFEADGVEPDALFLGGDGLLGNNELVIQFAEQEIVTRHIRDQGDDDHASGVFGAQKVGAGLLRGAAILPPEIDNVAQA